jgi:hypothetical protein
LLDGRNCRAFSRWTIVLEFGSGTRAANLLGMSDARKQHERQPLDFRHVKFPDVPGHKKMPPETMEGDDQPDNRANHARRPEQNRQEGEDSKEDQQK